MEFVESQHTPRDTLLRAVRTGSRVRGGSVRKEYDDLVATWGSRRPWRLAFPADPGRPLPVGGRQPGQSILDREAGPDVGGDVGDLHVSARDLGDADHWYGPCTYCSIPRSWWNFTGRVADRRAAQTPAWWHLPAQRRDRRSGSDVRNGAMSTRAYLRHPGTHEQLIAALLPDVTALQPTPLPAPMPSLSAPPPRLLLVIAGSKTLFTYLDLLLGAAGPVGLLIAAFGVGGLLGSWRGGSGRRPVGHPPDDVGGRRHAGDCRRARPGGRGIA